MAHLQQEPARERRIAFVCTKCGLPVQENFPYMTSDQYPAGGGICDNCGITSPAGRYLGTIPIPTKPDSKPTQKP